MGMFDYLEWTCSCGRKNEKQTKKFDCLLYRYDLRELPQDIAIGLNGETFICDFCGESITVRVPANYILE